VHLEDAADALGLAGRRVQQVLRRRGRVGRPVARVGSLVDTGSTVSLSYTLPAPVTADQETNFFRFAFRFNHPITIDLNRSTVTYNATGLGVSFTQTTFVCHTDNIPDLGCGSNNGVTGISLNLAPIPETATWLMFGPAVACMLRYRRYGVR
jgi:hypothetical protein